MRTVRASLEETVAGLEFHVWIKEHGDRVAGVVDREESFRRTVFGVDMGMPDRELAERMGELVTRFSAYFKNS